MEQFLDHLRLTGRKQTNGRWRAVVVLALLQSNCCSWVVFPLFFVVYPTLSISSSSAVVLVVLLCVIWCCILAFFWPFLLLIYHMQGSCMVRKKRDLVVYMRACSREGSSVYGILRDPMLRTRSTHRVPVSNLRLCPSARSSRWCPIKCMFHHCFILIWQFQSWCWTSVWPLLNVLGSLSQVVLITLFFLGLQYA
jgi:hypothetical protein